MANKVYLCEHTNGELQLELSRANLSLEERDRWGRKAEL